MHVECCPIADGGSGTIELLQPLFGGHEHQVRVAGPVGGFNDTVFFYNGSTRTGLVESSRVIGLELLPKKSRNPLIATSFPLGQILARLLDMGAETVLVGLGDTATLDYGVGMAAALGFKFMDEEGIEAIPGGGETERISRMDRSGAHAAIGKTQFIVLADIRTPLFGERSIARIFGPQKGADEAGVSILERGGVAVARTLEDVTGTDITQLEMGGAAGGIAGMMKALLGAELKSGSRYITSVTDLPEKVKRADIIITGEGMFDSQTFYGKAVSEVINLAAAFEKPVSVICAGTEPGVMARPRFRTLTGERLGKKKGSRLVARDLVQLAVLAVEDMTSLRR
jgi:glycerate kinase